MFAPTIICLYKLNIYYYHVKFSLSIFHYDTLCVKPCVLQTSNRFLDQ